MCENVLLKVICMYVYCTCTLYVIEMTRLLVNYNQITQKQVHYWQKTLCKYVAKRFIHSECMLKLNIHVLLKFIYGANSLPLPSLTFLRDHSQFREAGQPQEARVLCWACLKLTIPILQFHHHHKPKFECSSNF